MIKVLMIGLGKMDQGGTESYLMSVFRNTDHNSIQMDFLVHRPEEGCYEEEIKKAGGKIIKLPRLREHPWRYCYRLFRVIRDGRYNIVHRHSTASVMWIDLLIAMTAGVRVRIAHSHNTDWEKHFIHYMGIPILNLLATDRFACSKEAGRWMFGRAKFHIMKNGINTRRFAFNQDSRIRYRELLNIGHKTAVLNVGRLVPEKNQKWIIDLASAMKSDPDIEFFIVGDGPLREELNLTIHKKGLSNKVHLLGQREDTACIMMACDMLILPSVFEGMGIVLIEAQCTGLPCIVSDALPREADAGKCIFLKLDLMKWKQMILKMAGNVNDRSDSYQSAVRAGFEEKTTAKRVLEYYKRCLKSTS